MVKQLTSKQRQEIINLYSKGKITQKKLAEDFGVAVETIHYHLNLKYKDKK